MWKEYYNLKSIDDLLDHLSNNTGRSRIIAGGTDLMLELERGVRPDTEVLLDISRIPGLSEIYEDDQGLIHISSMVTHNDILSSNLIRSKAFPLFQACWQIGSPQIRNRGTVVGNLVTASPANDTITPLLALNAFLMLRSKAAKRTVNLADFYKGVRRTTLKPDEFVEEIIFKGIKTPERGYFIKSALRRAQAISVVNACVVLELEGETIHNARITLGSVAPTIIHAKSAECYLDEKSISDEVIFTAADLAGKDAAPISDVRGSDQYRSYVVSVIVKNALLAAISGEADRSIPEKIVRLDTSTKVEEKELDPCKGNDIVTNINGNNYVFKEGFDKTLLHLIRENANLTGTKEGCGEGECGACTIYLDGKAVMSCLVPAPRAHQAKIVTIEGLQRDDQLHPIQQSFIDHAAVQCGFCTPGFVMSSAKLLEEIQNPTQNEIKQAITGNLCRCTGYYKIVEAIEAASKQI